MTTLSVPKNDKVSSKISRNFHGRKSSIRRVQKQDIAIIWPGMDTRKNRIRPDNRRIPDPTLLEI